MFAFIVGLWYGNSMLIMRGNKFRIEPNGGQQALMRGYAGTNRFIWNKALAIQKERLENKEKLLSYKDMAALLPEWKMEFSFLSEAPSQTLQQTLMQLDKAIWAALDKTDPKRFPVFKRKGIARNSFLFPQGFKIDEAGSRVFLPKLGWVRYRKSKSLSG